MVTLKLAIMKMMNNFLFKKAIFQIHIYLVSNQILQSFCIDYLIKLNFDFLEFNRLHHASITKYQLLV